MTDLAAVPWRTGRTLGRTIYARTGGDDWKSDTPIGMLDTRELAEAACAAHNAALVATRAAERVKRAGGPLHGLTGVQIGDGGTQNNVFG